MSFVNTSAHSDFSDYTLVLPSLSIGNVGQLAIDLLISTLKLERAGYFDDENVIPVAGNDAFSPRGTGQLCCGIEVYIHPQTKTLFMQQRSPVATGRNTLFATNVLNWVKEAKMKGIIVVHSADAGQRIDSQLTGTQFRYYGKQVCENNLNKVDWRELEESTVGDVVKQGTVAQRLHKLGQELGIPVLLAIRFCYEGDNNIHDGVQMASLLNGYLGLIQNEGEVRWIMPESWSVLLNNPHVNPFLFG